MTHDTRREAEAFLEARPMSIPITEEPECVDALVAFVKAQRVQVWEEAVRIALNQLPLNKVGTSLSYKIAAAIRQRAKELE